MTEAQLWPGHEQFLPPQPPPGMYFDAESRLFLPQGVRLASRGRVAAAWLLGFSLFIVTLGIGYIVWSAFVWGQGRSPAQRMLGLRCWQPELGRVAGRKQLALRQIVGFCLNGQLLAGFFIWLTSNKMRSVGDFFADTVLIHDPDGILPLSPGTRSENAGQECAHVGERPRVSERVVSDSAGRGHCRCGVSVREAVKRAAVHDQPPVRACGVHLPSERRHVTERNVRVQGPVARQYPGTHQAGLRSLSRLRGDSRSRRRGQAAMHADRPRQGFA
jgi:hypothetical protein